MSEWPNIYVRILGPSEPLHLFYFIRTPYFSPRLDVLIFSAISASDVLINVLNYLTVIIWYLRSTTAYLILNTTVFSLSYIIE